MPAYHRFMDEVAKLLNAMVEDGVISAYAVFGAVAQMRYTEAVVTLDADILVAVPEIGRLDVLTPIYEYCASRGFKPEGEAIRVGAWPVQFIPVFDALTQAALQRSDAGDIDGVPLRAVTADYLAVIGLSVGRPKDFARILALLEAESTSAQDIETLSAAHGLTAQWERFRRRFLDA
ncbi:MAG: hypothetical protein HQ523_02765 [Lentisphaerae bacterium]|nr:hypothetical protein [Lentisphaerota bacterium]